jgi:hypothetical protein
MSFCYPEGNFGRNQLLALLPKAYNMPPSSSRLASIIEGYKPSSAGLLSQ